MRIKHTKKIIFILAILFLSCGHKKLKIQHLSFFDDVWNTYMLGDTARVHPLVSKSMFFSINQSNLKRINLDELDLTIRNDSSIQNELRKDYFRVEAICYKESDNLDEAIKKQSNKLLTLSNDDMVAEYVWEGGKIIMSFYYEDGKIIGSDKIKLESPHAMVRVPTNHT